jgi:CDP-4-dehydro-6-deoxyglucose reductase
MLPWDKLAQFVVVAVFEWLDWLPLFKGTLIRNFITQAAVNDRLFTLLSFIHLGVPLLVLLLMWVHVQRVPKSSTNPPRPIMIQLSLALLVLALIKPAQSQGGAADFGATVTTIALDWFLLLFFPLLYIWPLARAWAAVTGATALLSALPWLPPKFRRGKTPDFELALAPEARKVRVRNGETLLEAGLRACYDLPYECRNGGCGVCKCTIVGGRVDHGIYQPSVLSEDEKSKGMALMCCATALSDVEIDYVGKGTKVSTYHGRVAKMERLSEDVMRLFVALPAGQNIEFRAGQYINIVLPDGGRRAFSFANPPHQRGDIELHVRRIPGGRYTGHVFSAMQVGDAVDFEGPLGSFTLRESERPILFVAGATGFAPIKSIVEDAFHRGIKRPMRLYWGVRKKRDLYLQALAERWQEEQPQFTFIPVLSEPSEYDRWTGRTGVVHEAILADFPELGGYEVYVCGSVQMVDAAFPAFLRQGLSEEFCFSDAFVPSARR